MRVPMKFAAVAARGAAMSGTTEPCSICGKPFDVQFRYQMEDKNGGLSFYCSLGCLRTSQTDREGAIECDGCGKRFAVELVSNVLYVGGLRRYACSKECRAKLAADGQSVGAFPQLPRAERACPTSRARVVAVFNHKGGTGKTTTSVHLAAGLAACGKRVLLVDTDAQGNVAASLGLKPERTLYHVLVMMGVAIEQAVVRAREGLDLLASNESLAAAELYLAGRQNRDRVLSRRLEPARKSYDVVVVDCSPSLSLMNQNALVFADMVLVPVACDYLSLVGVRQVLRTVKNVNQHLHHPVQLWGVLPTFFDGRARICREAHETLKEHFGHRCLAPIRATTKVKEAPAEGRTVFEHAPESHAAGDYQKLVEAFLAESRAPEAAGPLGEAAVYQEAVSA
jgi:chromosome partitioning protein